MATHSLQNDKTNETETELKDDNPVRDYLRSLVWDGTRRLNETTASEHEIVA